MARPTKCRRICSTPRSRFFTPEDGGTEQVNLTMDEYEAVRLLDYEGMTQEQCAAQMKVARATITLIYDSARKKLADSLVNGKLLRIEGGNVILCEHAGSCCGHCGKKICADCGRKQCKEH